MVDACTCLEVFGEDPNCPLHSYEALESRVMDLEALIEAQHGDVVVRTAKLLYDKDVRIAELKRDIETFWKPQFDEQVERAEKAEALCGVLSLHMDMAHSKHVERERNRVNEREPAVQAINETIRACYNADGEEKSREYAFIAEGLMEARRILYVLATAPERPITSAELIARTGGNDGPVDTSFPPELREPSPHVATEPERAEASETETDDTIIAWFGEQGTEWRRKDNKSPAGMTKPKEYIPVPASPPAPVVTDEMVRIGGDILMQNGLNAPEQEIYRAMRAALEAALANAEAER